MKTQTESLCSSFSFQFLVANIAGHTHKEGLKINNLYFPNWTVSSVSCPFPRNLTSHGGWQQDRTCCLPCTKFSPMSVESDNLRTFLLSNHLNIARSVPEWERTKNAMTEARKPNQNILKNPLTTLIRSLQHRFEWTYDFRFPNQKVKKKEARQKIKAPNPNSAPRVITGLVASSWQRLANIPSFSEGGILTSQLQTLAYLHGEQRGLAV